MKARKETVVKHAIWLIVHRHVQCNMYHHCDSSIWCCCLCDKRIYFIGNWRRCCSSIITIVCWQRWWINFHNSSRCYIGSQLEHCVSIQLICYQLYRNSSRGYYVNTYHDIGIRTCIINNILWYINIQRVHCMICLDLDSRHCVIDRGRSHFIIISTSSTTIITSAICILLIMKQYL